MSAHKTYLGDAVYADFDDYGSLWLTTEDGIQATNTICLEPQVYAALLEYVERLASRPPAARGQE